MKANAVDVRSARAGRREWWGLAVLALPILLLSVDLSVLYLAMPRIAAELGLAGVEQLWVVDIYGFMVAGFLVTMGTLGDRLGHRRLLLAGAACFGIASVLAASATSAPMLIAARAVLGIAGATLAPTTLALITRMFTDPRQRAVAVAVWPGCFMGGSVLGPVVGGLLLSRFWWGSVFLLAMPVTAILLVAGPVLLSAHRGSASGRLDPASVGMALGAVLPVVYGVKELARDAGPALPLLALVTGTGFGLLFARRQRRLADPVVDLSLFRIPIYRSTVLISLSVGALQGGGLLVANSYLQLIEGLSPFATGLWLVPPACAMLLGIAIATNLGRTIRPAILIAGGLACSALGNFVLTQVPGGAGRAGAIAGLCLVMVGVGPMVSLGYGIVLAVAPVERAGSASATMETGGQLGIAVGVGVLGSIATAGGASPSGLGVISALSAVVFAALAAFAALSLRQVPATAGQPR